MLYGFSYVKAQSSIKLNVENSPKGKTWGTSIAEQVVQEMLGFGLFN